MMLSRWYQDSSGPIADAAALRPSCWEGVIVMSGYTKGPLLRPLGIQRDDHVGESIHHLLVMKHTDDRARVLTRLRLQDLQDTQGEVWIEVRNRLQPAAQHIVKQRSVAHEEKILKNDS